jgi:hypothetical protein
MSQPLSAAPVYEHALKCEMASEVLRSSGSLRLRVTGWSMLPAVFPGDTLLIQRADSQALSKGDIALFSRGQRLFAHRVIAKSGAAGDPIITQGDGMLRPDPPVSESEVLGKVSFIIRNGRLIEPQTAPDFRDRTTAALIRRSHSAARIVVGVHSMLQERNSPCPS